jgi:hypothetical protein
MASLIIAVFAASLVTKHMVTARTGALGCVALTACWDLLLQYHPVPLLLACLIGFFPVWGALVIVRKASFLLLAPAVILVMLAGGTVDWVNDKLADRFDMHAKPVQEQIDSARQYLKDHPTK